mmetsp:Transcript_2149/g.8933  ORF Transcript_2149/g.8933 Transcript_2149/m.8933 type:complete len:217 (+) Transcript_2149:550-1200(+)
MRTVLSSDAETTLRPFGEKSPQRTQFVCPLSVERNLPSGADQSFSVLSCDAETSFLPSGEKRTERTAAPCALSTFGVYRPTVLGVHNRTVRSLEPLAMHSPCGEYATDNTESLCPAKRYARMLGLKFQIMSEWSPLEETSCFMLGLNAHAVTPSLCPRNVRSSEGSSLWKDSFAMGTPPNRTMVGDAGRGDAATVDHDEKASPGGSTRARSTRPRT